MLLTEVRKYLYFALINIGVIFIFCSVLVCSAKLPHCGGFKNYISNVHKPIEINRQHKRIRKIPASHFTLSWPVHNVHSVQCSLVIRSCWLRFAWDSLWHELSFGLSIDVFWIYFNVHSWHGVCSVSFTLIVSVWLTSLLSWPRFVCWLWK